MGGTVIRFSLKSFSTIDSRPIPDNLSVQASTVSDDYIFFGNGSVVYRYDIATLANKKSLASFDPNIIRFLKVDPFDNNLLHIDHRFPGLGPRDPTWYPFQYIRASVNPFQFIDTSSYSINRTEINQANYLNAFKGAQYFQFTGNLIETEYAVPVVVKVDLSASPKEISALQHQGSEFLARADFAQNSLILASSNSLMKKSLSDDSYKYVPLPAGTTFQSYYNRLPAVITSDELFG
jgi:hypothetical protein